MEWSKEDLVSLLKWVTTDPLLAKKRFNQTSTQNHIDWDKVSADFPSAGPEECQEAFQTMTTWVYRKLTVGDVAKLARDRLSGDNVPLEMIPNAPKKPVSAYQLFCTKRFKSVKKDNPEASLAAVSKIVHDKWIALSPDRKTKWVGKYNEEKKVYTQVVARLAGKRMQQTVTPFDLYKEVNPLASVKDFNSLKDKEQAEWMWAACRRVQAQKTVKEEAGGVAPQTLYLNLNQKRLLLKSEGILEKPKQTLRAYFCHKYPSAKHEYKLLDSARTAEVTEQHLEEVSKFVSAVSDFLSRREGTLGEEEQDQLTYTVKTYKKLINKLSKKVKSASKTSFLATHPIQFKKKVKQSVSEDSDSDSEPTTPPPSQAKRKRKESESDDDSDSEHTAPAKKVSKKQLNTSGRQTVDSEIEFSLGSKNNRRSLSKQSRSTSEGESSPSRKKSAKKSLNDSVFESVTNDSEVTTGEEGERKKKKKKAKKSLVKDEL